MTLEKACSFNNKLILESYQRESGPRHEVRSGWSTPGQKNNLKGLMVLVGAKLTDGTTIPPGSVAYIKEESLHTLAWAKNILHSDTLKTQFLIAPLSDVEYFVPPTGDVA